MPPVRVAIIGVGNCASALIQGLHSYRRAPDAGFIPNTAVLLNAITVNAKRAMKLLAPARRPAGVVPRPMEGTT